MYKLISIIAIFSYGSAFPVYLAHDTPILHSVPHKTTITKSSHAINHGGHAILHAPVLHTPVLHETHPVLHESKTTITRSSHAINHGHAVLHAPVVHAVHAPVVAKTTITRSSHAVNHGGHAIVHAPVVHAVHAPVLHAHAPLVALKSGDHAVSHSSQSVHETVPLISHH